MRRYIGRRRVVNERDHGRRVGVIEDCEEGWDCVVSLVNGNMQIFEPGLPALLLESTSRYYCCEEGRTTARFESSIG